MEGAFVKPNMIKNQEKNQETYMFIIEDKPESQSKCASGLSSKYLLLNSLDYSWLTIQLFGKCYIDSHFLFH
jgi:hypothetical protein